MNIHLDSFWNTLGKIKQKHYLFFAIYIYLALHLAKGTGVEDFARGVQISETKLVWTDDKTVLNYQSHVSNN